MKQTVVVKMLILVNLQNYIDDGIKIKDGVINSNKRTIKEMSWKKFITMITPQDIVSVDNTSKRYLKI